MEIPEYPSLRPIVLTDHGSIRSFQADIKCFSDFDFGSLWSWNYAGTTCICQLYGNLVVSMRGYQDGREALAVNGEFDVDRTARRLLEDRSNGESPARLELVPKHFTAKLNREVLSSKRIKTITTISFQFVRSHHWKVLGFQGLGIQRGNLSTQLT